MASKPRNFQTNLYYHVYNCGVEKRKIFQTQHDYRRFLEIIAYYQHDQKISYAQLMELDAEAQSAYNLLNPKGLETLRVKLLAYCLMPNHFHLLVQPFREGGISSFLADIQNSHTRYFNLKNDRVGSLLQGTYKAKGIADEESLIQVTRYVHLNPIVSSYRKENSTDEVDKIASVENYPYSSYREWLNPDNSVLVDPEELLQWLKVFGGREKYREFVKAKIGGGAESLIGDLTLE